MTWKWPLSRYQGALAMGLLGLAAGGAMGCAEERDPINRVQANALSKSFFVGADLVDNSDNPDFYANGTLTDIGYGASQSALFTAWYSNNLSIIRWEVTEDLLLGRLAYERIEDSDGKGAGKETADGQMLYAFKIESHFDIRRGYNPTTGEELNVIEENTSDRPWYQREYFRVDWSKNLNTESYDYDNMALLGILDGVTYEPINYYINDPAHPDAPHFDPAEGYFDVTTRMYAKPQKIYIGWWGQDIPACFLDPDLFGGTAPAANCNPVEITIRNSFWKKPDRDYEPADWDGYQFQAFGPFLVERKGFTRNHGMSDDQWHRFISRYNVWQSSHYYADPENRTGAVACYTPETTVPSTADPTRDENQDGTHDECAVVGNGSRCDKFSQKCTLPFAQRAVRPIVWYYTKGSENRFFEGTEWATQEWDIAMRSAIVAARYSECQRIGGADCGANYPVPQADMYVMSDLVAISTEVDACRLEHRKGNTSCNEGQIVDTALLARGYDAASQDYVAMRATALMEEAVILCHSPIEASDHPLCGEGKPRLPPEVTAAACEAAWAEGGDQATRDICNRAHSVRIGDVRHHLINVIKTPQTPSPWGFGPTFADPLTGEAISASINVWSTPTDLIAQQTVDTARYIGGELSTADVTDGKYVKDWVLANEVATGSGAIPPMRKAEVHRHVAQARNAITRDLETGHVDESVLQRKEPAPLSEVPAAVLATMEKSKELAAIRADAYAATTSAPTYNARREQAIGTETEAALTNVMMQQYAGMDGALPTQAAVELASPLRSMNPSSQRELSLLKEIKLAERGACMLHEAAPSPTAMVGLTDKLQKKFGAFSAEDEVDTQLARAAKMHDYLAQRFHFAVIAHEMGHTFGYRHNFVSSSSAYNYRPQYWQLRTRDGKVSEPCNELVADGSDCVDRRYFDPMTPEEQDQLIWMFMHSSMMDYAGDITQDLLGLSAYDYAAAKMFYGQTATVYTDPAFAAGQPLSGAIVETTMDNFGGIVGFQYQNAVSEFPTSSNVIHYSQLQANYNLIQNCKPVETSAFKPANWNEERWGVWDETIDGMIVQVDGQFTRCRQQPVDYVHWEQLRFASGEAEGVTNAFNRAGPAIDHLGRTRVPYAFATDRWADIGNTSVYRHDVGADPYELFNFFVTEQEIRHIFDNYRRNRTAFNVRGAANRILGRYNGKMRDSAKGLALQANFFRDLGANSGIGAASYFDAVAEFNGWQDNLLAAGLAFDHFSRQMQRPQAGPHAVAQYGISSGSPERDGVLRSDTFEPVVNIPDGASGYWSNIGIGGKLVENQLANNKGEYDSEFTLNAGSYYDKINTAMLYTESVDNFISSSLEDFTDPRYRSVSLADMFPDGYRRWLANNLTNDDWIQAPRLVAAAAGNPVIGPDKFPSYAIGWTSWWTDEPQVCFPNEGTTACTAYGLEGNPLNPQAPANTIAVDPQIAWEQQKFLIAWTLVYLPENQKQTWLDMMGIWQVGADSDPGFTNRIEFHAPTGDIYVARTYGTEEICFESTPQVPTGCKTVQRGIGARILEYANELMSKAYITTPVTVNGTTWYEPIMHPVTGQPIVAFDRTMDYLDGFFYGPGPNACDQPGMTPTTPCCGADPDLSDGDYTRVEACTCDDNRFCQQLGNYLSVPKFMRTAMRDFRMADVSMKGIYD